VRNKITLTVSGASREEIYDKALDVVAKYIGVASVAEAKTQITGMEVETKEESGFFTAEVWINLK
jgi:hypothetical protein